MLGVWDDRFSNNGDISNARIYRKVHFDEGDYFFGAKYNALYQMSPTYMFFNDIILPTSEIASEALAWCDINDACIDDDCHGIHFTVRKPGDYFIGWQADMKSGATRQEFRADKLLLMKRGESGIEEISNDESASFPDLSQPFELYTLQGLRANNPVRGNIYLLHQGSRTWKYIHK